MNRIRKSNLLIIDEVGRFLTVYRSGVTGSRSPERAIDWKTEDRSWRKEAVLMKFNRHLPEEIRELLEKQYKEYIKRTSMTPKEQRVLREWVKDGHSVYENSSGAWYDGQVPVEFFTVYREKEYIRQHTKGMSPEDARKFALNYYDWDDDEIAPLPEQPDILDEFIIKLEDGEELPFS